MNLSLYLALVLLLLDTCISHQNFTTITLLDIFLTLTSYPSADCSSSSTTLPLSTARAIAQ
jgi:hypothetical protein